VFLKEARSSISELFSFCLKVFAYFFESVSVSPRVEYWSILSDDLWFFSCEILCFLLFHRMATIVIARAGGGDLMYTLGEPDDVTINDKNFGLLHYHSAFKIVVPAGHVSIRLWRHGFHDPQGEIEADVVGGHTYFYRVKYGLIVAHPHVISMDEEHKAALLKAHPLDKMEERTFK
jgi:hypothetical protein